MKTFTPPKYKENEFTCAFCGTYSLQNWSYNTSFRWSQHSSSSEELGLQICRCIACRKDSIWSAVEKKQVYPLPTHAPMPHHELPESCREDFMEARQIAGLSAKGAGALLRLCVQKLLIHLGEKGENINSDIALLVKKGLPTQVQQALDVCRVVGNNAVHPGELDVRDTPQLVHQLFTLINFIVEQQIEQPKRVAEMFGQLPQGAQDAVAKRDAPKPT